MFDPAGELLCQLGVIRRLPETGQRQSLRSRCDRRFHRLKATPQINGSTAVKRLRVSAGGGAGSAAKTAASKQRGGSEAGRYSLVGGTSR
jgi:hypothetical protein